MGEKVVAIVGARLNSSRLPNKHLLPLAGKPLINHIFERLKKIERLDEIVLATTSDDYNLPLRKWAVDHKIECFSYDADVNDLVGRIDHAVKKYNADILLYVCGDCPLIEPETIANMLEAIVSKPQVDTVKLLPVKGARDVIHEGFDIYRRGFWDKMTAVAEEPFEREHIGAVYHHLHKELPRQVATVIEIPIFSEIQHRISVDTPSDYRFMKEVYRRWYLQNGVQTIVDLKWVIDLLKNDSDLSSINAEVKQKTIQDTSPVITIFTEAGPSVGLGHLSRMTSIVGSLQDLLSANVRLVIQGEACVFEALNLLQYKWVNSIDAELSVALDISSLCIFDMQSLSSQTQEILSKRQFQAKLVGIDFASDYDDLFDVVWVPSFYVEKKRIQSCGAKLFYGWDAYLLNDLPYKTEHPDIIRNVLVLTGGSDAASLGNDLPEKIMKTITKGISVTWLQGIYAEKPILPKTEYESFSIVKAPVNIADFVPEFDAVICVYGVSFFECLSMNVPVFCIDALDAAMPEEWLSLNQILSNSVFGSVDECLTNLNAFDATERLNSNMVNVSKKLQLGKAKLTKTIDTLLKH